ncbi:Probable GTP-binding protein EngB [Peptostreptococcus anaerobius]|uniref:Probable GTP-binding protein EngB n=2 Tax=Peptostreptococcus anaerobius TaxID=1261 RepID=A0A379CII0_9FIRM|nr:ribosome biogenesis GTP-binding protein YihA/YsxC [Peptostreptococcus anaerobius]EKX90758.1 ribosome biogenesis GTP-binding protein YsxC [Peptostreptococcus anaerobius VPI 4330 = DSM 2949]SFM63235.1 GTP-binding protein [Peptostreptococcus anaerobius]SUB61516.1 Probable GTP-binding protein EngB [Peptostreptococcus anaerobius]
MAENTKVAETKPKKNRRRNQNKQETQGKKPVKKKVAPKKPTTIDEKVRQEEKMKIRTAEITMSAVNRSQYPGEGIPEIALAGRSNVGKSSVINGLLSRKNFARTSSTPGKTRTINFYLINEEFYFVDLPGYGYAKVAKTEKEKWGAIMEMYLSDRRELCAIFLLVDCRHEPTADDKMMYEWIKHFGYNCVVVATKADKISRGQYQKHTSIIRKKLEMAKEDKIILTSSSSNVGMKALWDEIVDQYAQHGYTVTYEKTVD